MKALFTIITLLLCATSFSQTTLIPDAVFEQTLIDLGHDTGPVDGSIPTANIDALTTLNVSIATSIGDLTGIEDFLALENLRCTGNQITSLDLSQNTSLTHLNCGQNDLTSLDVSTNVALRTLACYNNPITSLDVTANILLDTLAMAYNDVTSLDLSQNVLLGSIDITSNEITVLDLSMNPAITYLVCSSNMLSELDLSQNSALEIVYCDNNDLECLNVKNGNNVAITLFWTYTNSLLTCIEVDDPVWSTSNWGTIDSWTSFSNDCSNACSTSGLSELTTADKELIKIIDVMGRETDFIPNTVLIFIYSDGSTEYKMSVLY